MEKHAQSVSLFCLRVGDLLPNLIQKQPVLHLTGSLLAYDVGRAAHGHLTSVLDESNSAKSIVPVTSSSTSATRVWEELRKEV